MTIIITAAFVSVLLFTLALCWAAKRGDEAMTAYFLPFENSRKLPPTLHPTTHLAGLQMGCFPTEGKTVLQRLANWANAPLRANTRRHSLVQWLVRSRQLQ